VFDCIFILASSINDETAGNEDESVVTEDVKTTSNPLSGLRKAELLLIGKQNGIPMDKKFSKHQLIELIQQRMGENIRKSFDSIQQQRIQLESTPHKPLTRSSINSLKNSPIENPISILSEAEIKRAIKKGHELRSPQQLRVLHNRSLDPEFEYYTEKRVTRSSAAAVLPPAKKISPIRRKRKSTNIRFVFY
jgi:hypothetical protein